MHHKTIPLHDFTVDDETSIPFRYLPLEQKDDHDVSVPHRHNYYEIFIFQKGGGFHEIDFNEYPIEANSIHFVSPGQVHRVQRSAGAVGHVIFFSRDFFMITPQQETLLNDLPLGSGTDTPPIIKLPAIDMDRLLPILRALEAESQQQKQWYEEMVRQYLSILLLEFKRHVPAKVLPTPDAEAQLSRQFKTLLEKHFRTKHQVQDYAQLLHTTPKALNAALNKHTGVTASGHIYNRLLLEAKRLLKHSTLSVKEIAFFLSYEDPAHFSKFFKAQTGVSPAEFRER